MSKLPAPPKKITDPKFGNWWATAGHELQKLKKGIAVEALLMKSDVKAPDGRYYDMDENGIVGYSISGRGLKGPKPINLHLRKLYYKQNNLTPAEMKKEDDANNKESKSNLGAYFGKQNTKINLSRPNLPLSFYQ